ncbi:MAG TPA: hypothetical protein P5509_00505 [Bacteroidales bacterium]|nr:hypothetical protein [Bacteroidales bacterium]
MTFKLKLAFGLLILFNISCITTYNYNLSISGIENYHATQNAVLQYIPYSVDAAKGTIANDIEIIKQQLDSKHLQIKDSLHKDLAPIINDTIVNIKFTINALDPENQVYSTEYERSFEFIL